MIPEWARRSAQGDSDYMTIGAVLPTRDGRVCGNAVVCDLAETEQNIVALVITDAGNVMRLTRREIEEWFYPPVFIQKLTEVVRRRMSVSDESSDHRA